MEFPAEKFIQTQNNKLGESRGRFNAASNYASAIGGPCTRQLVYSRTRAAEAAPLDETSMANILEGNDQEAAVIRWIQDMGYNFIRSQEAFSIDEPLIHGKIDGVIIAREGGVEVGKWTAEIKSIQPGDWERLNTQEDILRSESGWHQKWYTQLQLAIHQMKDTRGFGPYGVLLLKDKTKKRVKPIPFTYDAAVIERAIEKGIEVNRHVADGTLPDRVSFAAGHCKWCDYRLICNPEEVFMAGKNIEDREFLAKLREFHSIEASSKRADSLWNYIKETLRGVEYATCGEFQIEGKALKNGWKVNITQVFTPAFEELTKSAASIPTEAAKTEVFEELANLIEDAQIIENLQEVKGPAKAARDTGAITPEQAVDLVRLYEIKAKALARKGRAK